MKLLFALVGVMLVASASACTCSCCVGSSECQPTENFLDASCDSCTTEMCRSSFPNDCPADGTDGVVMASCGGEPSDDSELSFEFNGDCDQDTCCCPTGTATVVKVGDYLNVTASASGDCGPEIQDFDVSVVLSGTQGTFTWNNITYTVTFESEKIEFRSDGLDVGRCTANACLGSCDLDLNIPFLCFHKDTLINYRGQVVSFDGITTLDECHVPHVVQALGVVVVADCHGEERVLRLTEGHLVYTQRGLQMAGDLVPGQDYVFGDMAQKMQCSVESVRKEKTVQEYFGLSCLSSELLANGVKTSTFEKLHSIPAFWMELMGRVLGVSQAAEVGVYIVNLVSQMNLV